MQAIYLKAIIHIWPSEKMLIFLGILLPVLNKLTIVHSTIIVLSESVYLLITQPLTSTRRRIRLNNPVGGYIYELVLFAVVSKKRKLNLPRFCITSLLLFVSYYLMIDNVVLTLHLADKSRAAVHEKRGLDYLLFYTCLLIILRSWSLLCPCPSIDLTLIDRIILSCIALP